MYLIMNVWRVWRILVTKVQHMSDVVHITYRITKRMRHIMFQIYIFPIAVPWKKHVKSICQGSCPTERVSLSSYSWRSSWSSRTCSCTRWGSMRPTSFYMSHALAPRPFCGWTFGQCQVGAGKVPSLHQIFFLNQLPHFLKAIDPIFPVLRNLQRIRERREQLLQQERSTTGGSAGGMAGSYLQHYYPIDSGLYLFKSSRGAKWFWVSSLLRTWNNSSGGIFALWRGSSRNPTLWHRSCYGAASALPCTCGITWNHCRTKTGKVWSNQKAERRDTGFGRFFGRWDSRPISPHARAGWRSTAGQSWSQAASGPSQCNSICSSRSAECAAGWESVWGSLWWEWWAWEPIGGSLWFIIWRNIFATCIKKKSCQFGGIAAVHDLFISDPRRTNGTISLMGLRSPFCSGQLRCKQRGWKRTKVARARFPKERKTRRRESEHPRKRPWCHPTKSSLSAGQNETSAYWKLAQASKIKRLQNPRFPSQKGRRESRRPIQMQSRRQCSLPSHCPFPKSKQKQKQKRKQNPPQSRRPKPSLCQSPRHVAERRLQPKAVEPQNKSLWQQARNEPEQPNKQPQVKRRQPRGVERESTQSTLLSSCKGIVKNCFWNLHRNFRQTWP